MGNGKKLSPDEIRRLFDLNAETGEVRWTAASSQGRNTNKVAGSTAGNGYRAVKIGGTSYLMHRIVWALAYGEWPASPIDHIDGNRANNSVCNLRLVTPSQNMQNLAVTGRASASGLVGAIYVPGTSRRRERWESKIKVNGISKYLGSFKTPEEAQSAYLRAKAELHPFFSRNH